MKMSTREEAINVAVALALQQNFALGADAEKISAGGQSCDITVHEEADAHNFTAVECKHGQSATNKRDAVNNAKRWLKKPACWNAVALCYPDELKAAPSSALTPNALAARKDYLMAQVTKDGVQGKWVFGKLSDLAELIKDVEDRDIKLVVNTLKQAIDSAAESMTRKTIKEIAKVLQVLYEPKDSEIDHRPASIACLLLTNTALLHDRMEESAAVQGLTKLRLLQNAPNIHTKLLDNWRKIRKVDYAPVLDPAIAILENLPNHQRTTDALHLLVDACVEVAPRIRRLRFDHAGPLYHTLLESAKYDGSFYTSTPASILLAEIAMPPSWLGMDWADVNQLAKLKICDPACGTGTLLMASARAMQERLIDAGEAKLLDELHIHLVQDILFGLDINRHAIHLAASMLTLNAPTVNYDKMGMYQMHNQVARADKSKHGARDKVRAGSLDLLIDNEQYIPGTAHDDAHTRTTAQGVALEAPPIKGKCDLVIMNPPYTRNSLRNLHLPKAERELIQRHEIEIAQTAANKVHRQIIDQTALRTFFTPIADILLKKENGSLAMVCPFTICTSPSGKNERAFLTDPKHLHLELVITSHDNRRIFFSENTRIHECLIVARRVGYYAEAPTHTHFVLLAENPSTANGARQLAKAIRAAVNGDHSPLGEYGYMITVKTEQLRDRAWNEACFYDQALFHNYQTLLANAAIVPIAEVAEVEPAGRRVQDAFDKAKQRQSPDRRALWDHKTERQTKMQTTADAYIVPTNDMSDYAAMLWEKRSNLLLAGRTRLNLNRTPAVYSKTRLLGSAFVPVTPNANNKQELCKAWCVWLNSTLGVLSFLNIRQKQLTYPQFALDSLRSLPVPHPDRCDVNLLAQTFDKYANAKLNAFPDICDDTVRHALDEAVVRAVSGIDLKMIERCRTAISREPSVTNETEPLLACENGDV